MRSPRRAGRPKPGSRIPPRGARGREFQKPEDENRALAGWFSLSSFFPFRFEGTVRPAALLPILCRLSARSDRSFFRSVSPVRSKPKPGLPGSNRNHPLCSAYGILPLLDALKTERSVRQRRLKSKAIRRWAWALGGLTARRSTSRCFFGAFRQMGRPESVSRIQRGLPVRLSGPVRSRRLRSRSVAARMEKASSAFAGAGGDR